MLWDKLSQFREITSLLFCLVFSISSLVWNANFAVKTVSNSRKIGNLLSNSYYYIGDIFSKYSDRMESYDSVKKQRDDYLRKIEKYEYLLEDRNLIKDENKKLKELLEFSPTVSYPVIKAKVLTTRLNTIFRTIIINKGSDSGIRSFMPVVARLPDESPVRIAVVGKVISVNKDSAVIQPLINSGFTMGVKLSDSNSWAMLSGNCEKPFQVMLSYVDHRTVVTPSTKEQIVSLIGKPVFSSAGSGIFPANIPVGLISQEGEREGAFKTAFVEPFVKFSDLEYVTVIKKLPDKWLEAWPLEQPIPIEDPILAEPIYPEEGMTDSNLRPVHDPSAKKKSKEVKNDTKDTGKPKKDSRFREEEDEEDIIMRNGN
jgi:rod shape-determining protein MreC